MEAACVQVHKYERNLDDALMATSQVQGGR